MLGRITGFFLESYKESDYLVREKAKTLFTICVTILLIIIPSLTYSVTLHTVGLRALIPPVAAFILVIIALFFFKKGHFSISAHLGLVMAFSALWTTIFSGNYTGHSVERTDTIVLIIGLLTLTPLIILKHKSLIILYFLANGIIFIFFVHRLEDYLILSASTKIEYMLDNGITLIFVGVVSYKMFSINKGAMEKAQEDIHERKRLEQKVNQQLQFIHHIIDTIPNPIFVKDRTHRWILMNEAYCRMAGCTKEDLIGKSDFDLHRHEEAREFWEKDDEVFETNTANESVEKFMDSSGNLRWLLTRKKPAIGLDGEWILVGAISDVTELKKPRRIFRPLSARRKFCSKRYITE